MPNLVVVLEIVQIENSFCYHLEYMAKIRSRKTAKIMEKVNESVET